MPSTRSSQTERFGAKTRFDIRGRRGLWIDVSSETGGQRGWARLGTVRLLTDSNDSRVNVPSASSSQPKQSGNTGFFDFARSLTDCVRRRSERQPKSPNLNHWYSRPHPRRAVGQRSPGYGCVCTARSDCQPQRCRDLRAQRWPRSTVGAVSAASDSRPGSSRSY